MSLSRDVAHDWYRVERLAGYDLYECSRCEERKRAVRPEELPQRWCEGKLGRASEMDRSGPLKPRSDTNKGLPTDEDFRAYVRRLPCCACGAEPPSDPHHVHSRGAGFGDWIDGHTEPVGNLAPLCRSCHRRLDGVGGGKETFAAEHRIDLEEEARRVGRAFREREG